MVGSCVSGCLSRGAARAAWIYVAGPAQREGSNEMRDMAGPLRLPWQ